MMNSALPSMQKKYALEASSPIIDNTPQIKSSVSASDKQLQPDQVEISDASRQKLSASEEKEQQSDFFENVETEGKLGATSGTGIVTANYLAL